MVAAVEGSRARQIINELKQQRAQFSSALALATGIQEFSIEYETQHPKDHHHHLKPPSSGSDSSRARTLANSLKESRMNLVKQVELTHQKFHHSEEKSSWLKAHDSMGSGNTDETEAMSPSCSVSEGDHLFPSSIVTDVSGEKPIKHLAVQEEESDAYAKGQRDGAQPSEELSLPLQCLDNNVADLQEEQSEQSETQPVADVLGQKDSIVKGKPEEEETGDLTENHKENNYKVQRMSRKRRDGGRSSSKRPKSSSSSSSKTKQTGLQLRVEQAKQAKQKVDEYFRIKEELDSENVKPRATAPATEQRELTATSGSQGAAASDQGSQGAAASDQEVVVIVDGPKRLQELYASEVDQMRQELLASSDNIYRSNHHRRDQMNRMYLKSLNFEDHNKTLQRENEEEQEYNLRIRDVLARLKNEIAAVRKKAKRKTITTIKEGEEEEEDEEGEEVQDVPSSRAFKSAKAERKPSPRHKNDTGADSLEYSYVSSCSSSSSSSLKQKSRASAKSSKGKYWLPVLTEDTVEDLVLQTGSTLQSSCLQYDDDDDE